MRKIAIISASVRTGRKSNRVALFFNKYIQDQKIAETDLIDLADYDFPIFHERLRLLKDPSPALVEYAKRIIAADGVIIVTPEYNGGYPASLKNAIDVLYEEWHRKPVSISTVSDGIFGGSQVITSIQFSLWKIRAWTVPALFPVPKINDAFSEEGVPVDQPGTEKRAAAFIAELLWCIEAKSKMS
ncbi:NAD(P)H-dependent oxidoreductase [soil metagenome]